MPRNADRTRARILDAARSLFYGHGVRAVSVDAVAERAGVTKRTLYYHFRSKDELIAAYLAARDQPNLAVLARWFEESGGTLAERVSGMFARAAALGAHPKWKGCGFLRTAAELANQPGHPARKVAADHKKRFEAWLAQRIEAAGIDEAAALARRIALLLDGAFSAMLVHRDPSYAEAAGEAAALLVEAAQRKSIPACGSATDNGRLPKRGTSARSVRQQP